MIYIQSFTLPTQVSEEDYLHEFYCHTTPGSNYYDTPYPFTIFPAISLRKIDFDHITIFYGGNGSGKSTLLNILSQKVKAKRSSPYNTSIHMDAYVKRCSFQTDIRWCGEEFNLTGERSSRYDIGDITRVITSDDIFKSLLAGRIKREQIQVKANMLIKRNMILKHGAEGKIPRHLDFETGENDEYLDFVEARKKSYSRYIKDKLGKEERGLSNGENSFLQISQLMEDEGVYILDEPENSLSPEMQYNLSQLILYMASHNNSQIILATHSPFLLGIEGAKIYNLDEYPVKVSKFEELAAVRFYYDFLCERLNGNILEKETEDQNFS